MLNVCLIITLDDFSPLSIDQVYIGFVTTPLTPLDLTLLHESVPKSREVTWEDDQVANGPSFSDHTGLGSDGYQFRVCIYLSLIWYLLFDKVAVQGKSPSLRLSLPLLFTPKGLEGHTQATLRSRHLAFNLKFLNQRAPIVHL